MVKTLHIVAFNIPFPADYGGVIDIFYKLKALHKLGVKIILHCFEYGRNKSSELEEFCEKVYYYKRNMNPVGLLAKTPFIVQSRKDNELLKNLLKDNNPIFFEGLHTCAFLNSPELKNRIKVVRLHNIEHQYYHHLANLEKNLFRRYYLKNEAKKLLCFEENLNSEYQLICISEKDKTYYSDKIDNVTYVPAFHGNDKVISKIGKGKYVLFHADLSVSENNSVALELVKVLSDKALVIAGKNPSKQLIKTCIANKITLIPNPDYAQMQQLIADAQATVVYAFKSAGMKLKLLNSLFIGRFCIANTEAIASNELESTCVITQSMNEIKEKYDKVMSTTFTEVHLNERKTILDSYFNDEMNAKKIIHNLSLETVN